MALYTTAADVLKNIKEKKGSIKSLVIEAKYKNTKQLYALTVETLKYKDVIEDIIAKTSILKQVNRLSKYVAMVLIYDFLFGKGVQCGGMYKKMMHSRKSQLKSTLALIKVKRKVSTNKDLIKEEIRDAVKLPKYLRINTLLTSKEDVIQYFKKIGFTFVDSSGKNASDLKKKEFMEDEDVPNLLAFHPSVDLHDDNLYRSGEIIFQDKASCFPAMILSPEPGSLVIDACAAPGNKTSQIAAMMSNRGKIFAFDINARRLSTMDTMLLKAGVLCCQTKVHDFLKVDPSPDMYKKVKYILLDPSCSGSGIVNRLNSVTDDANSSSDSRLKSLAKFQLSALTHALGFPGVEKVVYSTCSIHVIENEDVVKKALTLNPNFELLDILPQWECRGVTSDGFDDARKCIRCSPEKNFTNGFFVASLKRKIVK